MRKLLFPPIVPSSLPAFSKRDTLRYYFKPSIANSMSQIKHMQMTIVRFDTNLSIIKNPFEILFFNKGDIREDIGKGFWFVDVSADIFPKSDTPYKIQIRLGEIDIEGMIDTQFGTVLKDLDKMSEWSIVTNVMPITVPDFGIQSLDTSVENKIFSTGNVFTGFYIAKDELKKETISSYQYNLYTYESFNDKKTWKLLSTSGEKYVGAETNISLSYSFPIELIEKSRYIVTMTIKSRNLFVETKIYRVYTDTNPSLEMFNTVYVKPNSEEGLMDISIISKQILMKPSDKTSKITYVLDEPGYESYPSLKGTHAIVDGKYYADDNVLMIEKNGVWICQLKTMFPIVHNNLAKLLRHLQSNFIKIQHLVLAVNTSQRLKLVVTR